DELPRTMIAYNTLLGRIPRFFIPNIQEERYTLSLIGKTLSTSEYQSWIDSLDLPDNVSKGGLYYWMMNSQKGLITAMTQSFLIGLIGVTLFVFFSLGSLKSALIFFIINLVPALATISIFYLLGMSLNVASITT